MPEIGRFAMARYFLFPERRYASVRTSMKLPRPNSRPGKPAYFLCNSDNIISILSHRPYRIATLAIPAQPSSRYGRMVDSEVVCGNEMTPFSDTISYDKSNSRARLPSDI